MVSPREQCSHLLSRLRSRPGLVLWCMLRSSIMHPYGWYYSCRNFLFFFPVWHSEGKTRGILAGLNENAFTRWWIAVWSSHSGKIPTWGEKRLSSFVSSIACYWCNPTITTTSSLSITISTHGESHGVTDFGVGSLTLLRLMNYHSWRFSFPPTCDFKTAHFASS